MSRALALIEKGALDGADVEALAERLGVGERQLRRLFRRHLGASPIAVAQTRRVLLAKQLIHETRLPMTEVALAAGFGSVRRFNETFQQLFGRPPEHAAARGDGRRDRGRPARSRSCSPIARPTTGRRCSRSSGRARSPASRWCRATATRARSRSRGAHGTVAVRPAAGNALRATIQFPQLSALPTIVARLRRVFDLVADPEVIGAQLAEDPVLAPLVAARPGLRVPGAWDGFELAVRADARPADHGAAARRRLAGKLVAAYGKPLTGGLGPTGSPTSSPARSGWPTPTCRRLGLTRARAAALGSLARAVVADPQLFGPRRSLEEAIAQLRALPGIGEWTAQYIAMRALREPDAFPAADVGLLRAMADRKGRRPTPAALLARAERWRPWRAYAAQHLWASRG